ncbi:MAG: nucleotidyltransferase domain-containing protein [Candidatus Micrarchaeota archaeon]
MILGKMYLKTSEVFGRSTFSISQFAKLHGISPQSAKVLLHRLKQGHQVFKTGHGAYTLLSPKHWIMLQQLRQKPRLYKLVVTSYEKYPQLSLLLLYGSQVRGDADRYSDYDVLLVLREPVVNLAEVRKEMEKQLGIRLHLTIYSEQAFKVFAISEPFLKFWFSEGMLFDETRLAMQLAKPTARLGYLEEIQQAKTYLGLLATERNPAVKAKYALTSLRILLLLEHALGLDYEYGNVKKELQEQLGELLNRIRRKGRVLSQDATKVEKLSRIAFGKVSSQVGLLGENESDIYWKKTKGEVLEPQK